MSKASLKNGLAALACSGAAAMIWAAILVVALLVGLLGRSVIS